VGLEADIAEAIRLYRLAAEQGWAMAQFCLGRCYESGTGVDQDLTESVRLYRLAKKQSFLLPPDDNNDNVNNENGLVETAHACRIEAEQHVSRSKPTWCMRSER
jgi:hypothetical protein